MKKLIDKLFAALLIILLLVPNFTAVNAAYTVKYKIINASITGNYIGGAYNRIYPYNNKPVYNYNLMVTSYSAQPQELLFNYDISSVYGKEIKKAEIIFASKEVVPVATKELALYEITGSWANNTSVGRPSYNTNAIAGGIFEYKELADDETKTQFGYSSLVNKGYTDSAEGSPWNNGVKDFDGAIDITNFLKSKFAEGKSEFGILMKGVASQLSFNAVRLFVTYTDNSVPVISLNESKTNFELTEDIKITADITDADGIKSVKFGVNGSEEKAAALNSDGKYEFLLSKEEMAKGNYTLVCTATDNEGASSSKTFDFTVGKPAEGENDAPVIDADIPHEISPLTKLYVPFKITDMQWDEIKEIKAVIDNTELTVNYSDDGYNLLIPESLISEGDHELTISACDMWGALGEEKYIFSATGKKKEYEQIRATVTAQYNFSTNAITDNSASGNKIMMVNSQGVLQNYDFSTLAALKKDIKKVEVLIGRAQNLNGRMMQVWAVNDWNVGDSLTLDELEPIKITEKMLAVKPLDVGDVLINKGYPSNCVLNMDEAVDITHYVCRELERGNTDIDLFYTCTMSSIYSRGIKILVTYKDNIKPQIDVKTVQSDNSDITIHADVTDDGEVISTEYYFDAQKLQNNVVPKELVTGNNHVIGIVAKDNCGAVSRMNYRLFENEKSDLPDLEFDKELFGEKVLHNSVDTVKVDFDKPYISADFSKYCVDAQNYSKLIVVYHSDLKGECIAESGDVSLTGTVYSDGTIRYGVVDISHMSGKKLEKIKIYPNGKKPADSAFVEKIILSANADFENGVNDIKIVSEKTTMYRTESFRFKANVEDAMLYSETVNWEVNGATDTRVNEDGVVTVGEAEACDYFYLTASSCVNPEIKDTVLVKVYNRNTEVFDENNVIMKLGVVSDTHMRDSADDRNGGKLENALRAILHRAGGAKELDAVLVTGDIADGISSKHNLIAPANEERSKKQAYNEVLKFKNIMTEVLDDDTAVFYCLGNHDTNGNAKVNSDVNPHISDYNIAEFFVKVMSGWDGNYDNYESYCQENGETYNRFFAIDKDTSVNGLYGGNRFAIINDYCFIALEPNSYGAEYTSGTITWLKDKLETAARLYPQKPIFVITHPKIYGTTVGSTEENYSSNITSVLNNYPQAIVITGHTHCSINDESAIMQTGFTSLEASSVSYLDYIKGVKEVGSNNRSQCYYISIDANSNVKIERMDTTYDAITIGDAWYINGTNPLGTHLYNYGKSRKHMSEAPFFEDTTKLSVETNSDGKTVVAFDAAKDSNSVVIYYKAVATNLLKVYVASHNEGVLLSDDFGKSWTSLGNPDVENNDYIRCIDVIDGIPVIVYNNAGVYRYYESNWEELNDGITLGNDMFYVAANPKNTKNLFVTCADCIYESTDGGMNWKPLKTSKEIGGKPVRLYFGESDCGELIMYLQLSLTSKNMRISTDFGKTFQKPEINHVNAFSRENTGYGAEAMAVSHINGMVSYVSFNGEIYKSSDGGKTYSSSSSGISGMRVCNYWFNPEIEDDIFMAVTDWGAVRTVPDVTESYLSVVDYSPMEDSTGIRKETQSGSKSCRAVCVDPKNTNKVFAVIGSWDSGTIKYSEDGGKNYISTDIFDCNAPVMNYVYDSQNNGVIYAGNYISYDGGISWVIQPCTVIGISETDSNIAYGAKKISETEIHLMRTDNYGKIWRECTDLNINGYQRCTVDLDNPGIAYIGGYSNGYSVYIWDENDDVTRYGRSTKNVFADIASKYNMSAIPIYMVAQDPADHDHLICGGVDNVYYKNMPGIFESFDRGESWNLVKGITGASDAWCIQFHPTIPSVFIATSAGTFVYEYDKSKNCDVVITHENDDVRVWNCQNVLINANVIGVTNDLVDEIAIVSFEPYENKVFDFESKKYFVWNNLDNLVPLCKALDLTEGR